MSSTWILFDVALTWLRSIPDYQSGAVVEISGEQRFYAMGCWWDDSFAAMSNVPHLTFDDIVPTKADWGLDHDTPR